MLAHDSQGNTLLLLCLKLSRKKSEKYIEAAEILINKGVSLHEKDNCMWSPLDEVVSQMNVKGTVLLFEEMASRKIIKMMRVSKKIDSMLLSLPDFQFSLKWEFESSVIPFIRKLAPSDTFVFSKKGTKLRVDYTMAGMKRLSVKRRKLSLMYNAEFENKEDQKDEIDFLHLVNWSKGFYCNILVLFS